MLKGLAISRLDTWVKVKFRFTHVKLERLHRSWRSPGFSQNSKHNPIHCTRVKSEIVNCCCTCNVTGWKVLFSLTCSNFLKPCIFSTAWICMQNVEHNFILFYQADWKEPAAFFTLPCSYTWVRSTWGGLQRARRGTEGTAMCHPMLSANEVLSVTVTKPACLRRSPEVAYVVGRVFVPKTSAKRSTFSAWAAGGPELKLQGSGSVVQQHWGSQPAPVLSRSTLGSCVTAFLFPKRFLCKTENLNSSNHL